MTLAQQARIEGFNASLSQRGVSLRIHPSGTVFQALVEPVSPEGDKYEFADNAGVKISRIHALRGTAGMTGVAIGTSFVEVESGQFHRVQQVDDHPSSVCVVITCQTTPAS